MSEIRKKFPEGFVFGAATAAYQIEGHSFGGAGRTIWDKFADDGGVLEHQNGAVACDHYHKYNEDFGLLADAGFDAYRFSFSWARLFPDGDNLNQEGVDFYDRLIDAMLAKDLKPCGTGYHWELPEVLGQKGGWANREIPERFGEVARFIGKKYGDRLDMFAPVNEPWCVSWLSYFIGRHAPGVQDISQAAKAMHNVLVAHGLAAESFRSECSTDVGCVVNFTPGYPATDNDEDKKAAERHNAIMNHWFLDAITHGEYPKLAIEALNEHMPDKWQDDMKIISTPLDFFGINFYSSLAVKNGGDDFPFAEPVSRGLPRTDMDWEIHPEAFGELIDLVASHTKNTPLYITENGMASTNETDDQDRIDYYEAHLNVLADRATKHPVKGYFAWSLLDNYEWAFGYSKRFGIIHVDYETQKRTPKKSYQWWKNGIS